MSVTIKRTTALFKLAKFGGLDEYHDTSICSFNWFLMLGIVKILVISISVILISGMMLSPVYYGILVLVKPVDTVVYDIQLMFSGLTLDILTIIGIGIIIYYENCDHTRRKEPSTIIVCWRAFKDKVCIKVDYK